MLIEKPTVSVIIPTYNRATVIERAIKSVQKQTFRYFEIIVVDDGSTDNTESVVRGLDDSRITYIKHEENCNGAVARNTGIDAATGEYIAFLDSDDEWLPEKLEKQIEKLQLTENNANIVCYSQLFFNEKNDNRRSVLPVRGVFQDELIDEYLFVNNGLIQTSTLMMPKLLLEKIKFNPTLIRHQDWDLCLQLFNFGVQFLFIDEPLVDWNDEVNLKRVSSSKDYRFSVNWINSYKGKITNASYDAFIEKSVLPQISFDDELIKKIQMIENIIKNKKIAIYGAGGTTEQILKNLTIKQREQIVGLIDQSLDKHGKNIEGIQIYKPSEIKQLKVGTIVVSVQNYKTSKVICDELHKKCNKKIVNSGEYFIDY